MFAIPNSEPLAAALALSLALALLGLALLWPRLASKKRVWLAKQAFPSEWRVILRKRVPMVRRLPTHLQLQLKQHMMVFLATKPFIGCAGLVVSQEMRVVVAAQACLLLLNRSVADAGFPKLRQILIYPGAFAVNQVHTAAGGVLQEQRQALAGESWTAGQVILSWQDTLDGAQNPDDGRNVVMHEFAHQLDQETGVANGAPHLHHLSNGTLQAHWHTVWSQAFAKLQADVEQGIANPVNAYGASDPAEFFAVATETFFETPHALQGAFPDLYAALTGYYRIDPREWQPTMAHPRLH